MSLAALVDDVLNGRKDPCELTPGLWSLWSDGFHAGAERVRAALARAEASADYWYLRAHYTPAEIDEMQQKAISDAFRDLWAADIAAYEALTQIGERNA